MKAPLPGVIDLGQCQVDGGPIDCKCCLHAAYCLVPMSKRDIIPFPDEPRVKGG